MRHKLCRSFHPWCPGVKNRCCWPLWGESTGDMWLPRTNCQLRGKWYKFDDLIMVQGQMKTWWWDRNVYAAAQSNLCTTGEATDLLSGIPGNNWPRIMSHEPFPDYCPACRTTFIATRFRVAVICPIIPVPHCIRVFFYFVWFVFINHIFQFYYELCTYCNILDIYLS